MCTDRSGGSGQLATSPLSPLVTRMSVLAGSRFGVKLISLPKSPPSTSPLSTRHNCVISSQERNFSIPILSRSAFPRFCIKFAFPRARVPKIPGTREHRNAKPGTRAHICSSVAFSYSGFPTWKIRHGSFCNITVVIFYIFYIIFAAVN